MKTYFKPLNLFILLIIIGCDADAPKRADCATTESDRGHIVSVLPLGSISASFLSDLLEQNTIDIGITPSMDVKVYSIVYETVDWNGEPRQASGATPKEQKPSTERLQSNN